MSAKFAARAQSIFGDNRLILIRAETEGGHGIGSARDLEVQEFADIFAFLEDRLGTNRALPSTMTGMAAASGKATRQVICAGSRNGSGSMRFSGLDRPPGEQTTGPEIGRAEGRERGGKHA